MAKVVKKPTKKNNYAMPEPLPKGEILTDITQHKWTLGVAIGKGGFGEIYSAYQEGQSTIKPAKYVIKIEPHENGPLFVERNFYMRNARSEDVDKFCAEKKLSSLGMPVYIGSGQHEVNNVKYRFLVMEKYGDDIWKTFLENKRVFPTSTVFQIGVQILDVLEYIHSKNYIHGDVKGANILIAANSKSQIYLVDFGLVSPITNAKVFKPDRKKAHNGTIEYLSRDAHHGVCTRRGDLEILAYNLIQWLGCTLPWEDLIASPSQVQNSKEDNMSDIPGFLKRCFGTNKPPDAIMAYLKYLQTLKFNDEPNYKKVRDILMSGLTSAGGRLGTNLQFKSTSKVSGKSPGKDKVTEELPKRRGGRKKVEQGTDEEDGTEHVKKTKKKLTKTQDTNEHVNGNDRSLEVKRKSVGDSPVPQKRRALTKKVIEVPEKEASMQNGTKPKRGRATKQSTKEVNGTAGTEDENGDAEFAGYTDAMKEVMKKKLKNAKGKGKQKKAEDTAQPSTSKSTRPRRTRPEFHQQIVNSQEDSSDEEVFKNVTRRKRV